MEEPFLFNYDNEIFNKLMKKTKKMNSDNWIEMVDLRKKIKKMVIIRIPNKYYFCDGCNKKIRTPIFKKCENCEINGKSFCKKCLITNIKNPMNFEPYCRYCSEHEIHNSRCIKCKCLITDCKYCIKKYEKFDLIKYV